MKALSNDEIMAELTRLRAEGERLQAELADLKARPESPHAKAIAEFEEDHRRRYEAGRKRVAEQQAAEERKLDEICASRSWVRVTTTAPTGELRWREFVEEPGKSEFRPYTGPLVSGQPSGEWVATYETVERTMTMAGGGYMLVLVDEWTRRVANSEELARLVARGVMVVTPVTPAEQRDHERSLLRQGDRASMLAMAHAPAMRGPL